MEVVAGPPADLQVGPDDLVAVGLFVVAGDEGPALAGPVQAAPPALAGAELPEALDAAWCTRQGFEGRTGQVLVLRSAGAPLTVLCGLGPADAVGAEQWRRAGAALVRQAGRGGTAVALLPGAPSAAGVSPADVAEALAEGAAMGAYRYTDYRTTPLAAHRVVDRLVVAAGPGADAAGVPDAVARGRRVGAAVCAARDLDNTPPSDLTPAQLAERAVAMLEGRPGVEVEVWDEARIAEERMGGLLAVSRGSTAPPRFVRAAYTPAAPEGAPHVVLVGKGVTFDSGGLSLKTADGMVAMKTDMSGAACVLSALGAAADLGVGVRVTALAPLAENMPGPAALKPGDVLATRGGQTIEVLNTDAEGRLLLADALALATELGPDAVIDVATLTGAVTVALGTAVAGLFGNRQSLVEELRRAGARAGEQLWPLPMPEDYRDHIDSDVADMKNTGRAGQAGSISAAILLSRFVGETPWAHLDIAGTGRSAEATGYLAKGATGFGVRTLVAFLRAYGAADPG